MTTYQDETKKYATLKSVTINSEGLRRARVNVAQMIHTLGSALDGWAIAHGAMESSGHYYRTHNNAGAPEGLYVQARCTFWACPNTPELVIMQLEHPSINGSVHIEVHHGLRQVSVNKWLLNPYRYMLNYFPHNGMADDYSPITAFLADHSASVDIAGVNMVSRLDSWGQIFPAKLAFRRYAESTYLSSESDATSHQMVRNDLWRDVINARAGVGEQDIQGMTRADRQVAMHIGALKLIKFDLGATLGPMTGAYLNSVIYAIESRFQKEVNTGRPYSHY